MRKNDVDRILSEALEMNRSLYVWVGDNCHYVSNVFYPTDARPYTDGGSLVFFDSRLYITAYIDISSITDLEIKDK